MPDTLEITLICHGALSQQMGGETVVMTLAAPFTPAGLLTQAAERWPGAAGLLARTACARGDSLLGADDALADGDTIALIPPVSGGQPASDEAGSAIDRHLSAETLDLDALLAETADDHSGALVVFGGTVRLANNGRQVESMDYSAYGPLAARTLADIEAETIEAFSVQACRIQHRTGRLGLGEVSVYVVVRAVHRRQAFDAASHALEELKARVAVWKNEYYADGSSAYLEGTEVARPERPRGNP